MASPALSTDNKQGLGELPVQEVQKFRRRFKELQCSTAPHNNSFIPPTLTHPHKCGLSSACTNGGRRGSNCMQTSQMVQYLWDMHFGRTLNSKKAAGEEEDKGGR